MNIKACFYFLSFYQLKIRDRSFYEFCKDAAVRGINFVAPMKVALLLLK